MMKYKEASDMNNLRSNTSKDVKPQMHTQWIDAQVDLPCDHEEMQTTGKNGWHYTDQVLVALENGRYETARMVDFGKGWQWGYNLAGYTVKAWMFIPSFKSNR